MRSTLFSTAVLAGLSGCGTLVRVVDGAGVPVQGAKVAVVYPSFDVAVEETDSDGCVRLDDAWFQPPWFTQPQYLVVMNSSGAWQFDYPPSSVMRLEPDADLSRKWPRRSRP